MAPKTLHSVDNVHFLPRETEVVWTLFFPRDAVFDSILASASSLGMRLGMASREHGLIIAKPPLSLLGAGRQIIFSLSAPGPARTRISARYVHGLAWPQSRQARLTLLDGPLSLALSRLKALLAVGGPPPPSPGQNAPAGQAAAAPRPAPTQPSKAKPAAARPAATRPSEDDDGPAQGGTAPASAPQGNPARKTAPGPKQPSPPRASPPGSGTAPQAWKRLDFGRLGWDQIPLEPPPPEDYTKYIKENRHSGLNWAARLAWLALGLGMVAALVILSEMGLF